jgi:hypothetical protein
MKKTTGRGPSKRGRGPAARHPVTDALNGLRDLTVLDTTGAIRYLTSLKDSLPMLRLYREVFPEEFANSREPVTLRPGEYSGRFVTPFGQETEDPPHTPRELEFFQLIDDRLFNLPMTWIEAGCRMYSIMVPSAEHGEEDPHSLRTSLQVAAALLSDESWISLADIAQPSPNAGDLITPAATSVTDYETVVAAFRQEPTPLNIFADALAVMNYDTGCIFLDFCCGCGGCTYDLDWSVENIRLLAEEHVKQREIFSRIDALDDWLTGDDRRRAPYAYANEGASHNADIVARINQIVEVWNRPALPAAAQAPAAREHAGAVTHRAA